MPRRRRELAFGEHDTGRCFACLWAYRNDAFRPGPQATRSMEIYEQAVEVIESYQGRGPFRRPQAWQKSRTGPTGYQMMGYALWDMRMHGLVDVVRWTPAGKAAEWEVIACR